jgi:hypothetical protein
VSERRLLADPLFSSSSGRLAAETEQRRTQLIELYARGRRHAPSGVRECEEQSRTIRTRSMDNAFRVEGLYNNYTLTRVSKFCLSRGIKTFNSLPAERRGVRSSARGDHSHRGGVVLIHSLSPSFCIYLKFKFHFILSYFALFYLQFYLILILSRFSLHLTFPQNGLIGHNRLHVIGLITLFVAYRFRSLLPYRLESIKSCTVLTRKREQSNSLKTTLFPVLTPLGSKEARRVGRVGSKEKVGSKNRMGSKNRVRSKEARRK